MNQLRKELIQIAAVAVAMIDDLDNGSAFAARLDETDKILREVFNEREAQDGKWSIQHRKIATWLVILGEEFGEACQAALNVGVEA